MKEEIPRIGLTRDKRDLSEVLELVRVDRNVLKHRRAHVRGGLALLRFLFLSFAFASFGIHVLVLHTLVNS